MNTFPHPCFPAFADASRFIHHTPSWYPLAYRWNVAEDLDPEGSVAINDTLSRGLTQSEVIRSGPRDGQIFAGYNPDPSGHDRGYHQYVSISVQSDMAYPAADAVMPPELVQNRASWSTALKARAHLAMGAAKVRHIDFDIGSGVEFSVGAHRVMHIQLLVPDPTAVQQVIQPLPRPAEQHSAEITTAVYDRLSALGHARPLTHTTPFGLNLGAQMVVAIVPDSSSFDVSIQAGGSVTVDMVNVPFVNTLAERPTNYIGAPTTPLSQGQIAVPAAAGVHHSHRIPGTVNALVITAVGGPAVGSLIQNLEL